MLLSYKEIGENMKNLVLPLILGLSLASCSSSNKKEEVMMGENEPIPAAQTNLPTTPMKVGVVNFAFDSAEVPMEETGEIESVVDTLRQNPETKTIVLKGHADLIGPEEYNYKLGYKRAMKVKEALVNKGLRAESIEVESFGEERPVVETMDKAESEINRRVVIQIRTDQEKITVSSN